MDLLLAERLLLLVYDDDKGRPGWGQGSPEISISGALLIDLARAGTLQLDGEAVAPAPGAAAPTHPLLTEALQVIREGEPRDAKTWVNDLRKEMKPLERKTAESLVDRGVLDEERSKALGIVDRYRFPTRDPEPERAVRDHLAAVLLEEQQPTGDDVQLIALARAYPRLIGGLVEKDRRKAAEKKAEALAEAAGTGNAAVDEVIDDVERAALLGTLAATIGAATVTTTVATTS
jgi:hypothetical protein